MRPIGSFHFQNALSNTLPYENAMNERLTEIEATDRASLTFDRLLELIEKAQFIHMVGNGHLAEVRLAASERDWESNKIELEPYTQRIEAIRQAATSRISALASYLPIQAWSLAYREKLEQLKKIAEDQTSVERRISSMVESIRNNNELSDLDERLFGRRLEIVEINLRKFKRVLADFPALTYLVPQEIFSQFRATCNAVYRLEREKNELLRQFSLEEGFSELARPSVS